MSKDIDPLDEFSKLTNELGNVELWTASERATYYAFFLHGWFGRKGEAQYQQ